MKKTIPLTAILMAGLFTAACADKTPPSWPKDARLSSPEVGPHSATLTWPAAVDDEKLKTYRLSQGQKLLAELPATTTSHQLKELRDAQDYSLTLVALDEAGNPSKALQLKLSTPDGSPPVWAAKNPLSHEVIEEKDDSAKIKFSWPEATDNVAVVRYALFHNNKELQSFTPEVHTHELESDDPDGTYELAAYDQAGLESSRGTTVVRTNLKRVAMLKELSQSSGLLAILGAKGSMGSGGSIADAFGSGSLGGDLDSAIGSLQGVQVGSGYGGLGIRGSGAGGGGSSAGIGGLGSYGYKREKDRVPGKVMVLKVTTSDLDSAELKKAVSKRMGAFKACYEKQLKKDSGIKGKISFSLQLEKGRVKSAQVTGGTIEDSAVRSCSARVFKRLRLAEATGQATVSLVYATN